MDAAVAAAGTDRQVFHDVVELGLVDGQLTGRVAARTAVQLGGLFLGR
jgi:hypothetical protein